MVRRAGQAQTVEATPATAAAPKAAASSDKRADIYIGFPKNDYAPRAGRKGRFITDDPSKYPAKEDLGFFAGATGGWAGGEAGLWKLREEVLEEKAASKSPSPVGTVAGRFSPLKPKAEGSKAPIYLGFNKSELDGELRKAGISGKFIVDDPVKYPGKEDLGFLTGATGGFAAGEKGLKQFIRDGDIQIRKEGQPGGQAGSPVAIAGVLVAAGVGGGLLLNAAAEFVEAQISSAPLDDGARVAVLVGAAAAGALALFAGGKAVAAAAKGAGRVAEPSAVERLVWIGGLWVGVFLAARVVLGLDF